MPDKPKDYVDIIALISFEDVPPMAAVGYTITENGHTVFFVKIARMHVDWDRIVAWRYLSDVWPEHLFYQEENNEREHIPIHS